MDFEEFKSMRKRVTIVSDMQTAMDLDLLLGRAFGEDYSAMESMCRNPKTWKFEYWSTDEEQEVIDSLMNDLIDERIDNEYRKLIREFRS